MANRYWALPALAAVLLWPVAPLSANAAETQPKQPGKSEIAKLVAKATGNKKIPADNLRSSLLHGFWELDSESPADGALLISKSGKDFLLGRVYEQRDGRLLEISGAPSRRRMLEGFGATQYIAFVSEEVPVKAWVWVFTDVTCTFCRSLHSNIRDYLKRGIAVRYLPFPRYGKGSDSWLKTSRAWCAEDRPAALTALKADQEAGEECASGDALDVYTDVAERIGVRATPTLILADGRKIDGLIEAKVLAAMLFGE